jgi:predicted nucleotidyltransferase
MERKAVTSDLVGTKEAAAIFRVRPSNFVRDWAGRADFPAPVASLARGRLWARSDLQAYRARRGNRRGANRSRLRLSPEAARWLPTIKRRIVRRFHPDRVVLFGSQARGKAGARSDIDLLVVLPEAETRRRAAAAVYATLAGIPVATDIIVATRADIELYGDVVGMVLRPALRDGITIYARA